MTEKKSGWKYFMRDFVVAGFAGAVANGVMAPVFNVNLSMNKAMAKLNMDLNLHKKNQSFFAHAFKLIKAKGIR